MTQYARPDSDISAGSWTYNVPESSLYYCIGEVSPSDTEYIAVLGVDSTCEVGLSNVTDPNSSSNHVLSVRSRKIGTGTIASITAYLYQGNTQICSMACNTSTTATTTNYTLSAAEADAISDYTDLRIRFSLDWTSGATTGARVTWAQLAVPDGGGAPFKQSRALLGVGW